MMIVSKLTKILSLIKQQLLKSTFETIHMPTVVPRFTLWPYNVDVSLLTVLQRHHTFVICCLE
jgi:hypothetical protein